MTIKNQLLSISLCLLASLAYVEKAGAVTITVPGYANPWLANATIDGIGTPEPPDVAPDQSPIFAGIFAPGSTISWSATGIVGHPGDEAGPDGSIIVSRFIGANNGISDLPNTPINSLIGVWTFTGGGTSFFMGSSGTAVVPADSTGLYLGTMDGYGWANNTGEFRVVINNVPEAGSTALLLLLGLGFLIAIPRKVTS